MAYTDKQKESIINEVCELIESGLSLRKALIQIKLPAITFYEWIDNDLEKAKQYARACEMRTELLVDEILEMADEQNADTYTDDEGNTITDGSAIQRSRLKVDARKWLASKMNPKKYGDKLDITSKDEQIKEAIDYSKLSTDVLRELKQASNE